MGTASLENGEKTPMARMERHAEKRAEHVF